MACLKLSVLIVVASLLVMPSVRADQSIKARATTVSKELNGVEVDIERHDQLTSGSVAAKEIIPDSEAVAATNGGKGDLKSSDSFGLGYYLPIVGPALVKYHYPLFYYHPAAYLHSIRHHGYGGYGFYQHGHGVLH